jgi:hypothetical protein
MREIDKGDGELDRLFDLARAVSPPVSDDLMARIMADADAAVVPVPVVATSAPVQGGWRGWVAAIGGWPAMGGLALATVVGVAIGISPPSSLSSITSGILGETLELQLSADADPITLLEG